MMTKEALERVPEGGWFYTTVSAHRRAVNIKTPNDIENFMCYDEKQARKIIGSVNAHLCWLKHEADGDDRENWMNFRFWNDYAKEVG